MSDGVSRKLAGWSGGEEKKDGRRRGKGGEEKEEKEDEMKKEEDGRRMKRRRRGREGERGRIRKRPSLRPVRSQECGGVTRPMGGFMYFKSLCVCVNPQPASFSLFLSPVCLPSTARCCC